MAPKKDTELDAMQTVQKALKELDDVARVRVINWTIQKLSINHPQLSANAAGAATNASPNRQQLSAGLRSRISFPQNVRKAAISGLLV